MSEVLVKALIGRALALGAMLARLTPNSFDDFAFEALLRLLDQGALDAPVKAIAAMLAKESGGQASSGS